MAFLRHVDNQIAFAENRRAHRLARHLAQRLKSSIHHIDVLHRLLVHVVAAQRTLFRGNNGDVIDGLLAQDIGYSAALVLEIGGDFGHVHACLLKLSYFRGL